MMINILKEKMRKLMKAEQDFYKQHIQSKPDKEIPENIIDEHRMLQHKITHFGDECASYPELFDILEQWMVDVKGQKDCNEEMIKEVCDTLDFEKAISEIGDLPDMIQQFVKEHGFKITDRGFGCGGWHIGVPCNEINARRLCYLLHLNFPLQIRAGIIRVERHFWKWRFPDLRH